MATSDARDGAAGAVAEAVPAAKSGIVQAINRNVLGDMVLSIVSDRAAGAA